MARRALLRRMLCAGVALGLATAALAAPRDTSAGLAREQAVKAGFIFNFTKFVDWPPQSFAAADAPFVIGVLNSPGVLGELEKAVAGRRVGRHEIVVRALKPEDDLRSTHVIFVGAATPSAQMLLKSIADQPILTIGESERFAGEGGAIGFVFDGDKLRFEINVAAAARANLKISAQLQKLARAVRHKA